MYLTAQRVVSPATHERGVNVYFYRHGTSWKGDAPETFLPEKNPGDLAQAWTEIRAGGNRVLSYLDVVAPDDFPPADLQQRLLALKHVLQEHGNPTIANWGPLWIRFGSGVAIPWTTELGALSAHIVLALNQTGS